MTKQTKDAFRIENIEVEEKEGCYKIKIEWFSTDSQLGNLGEYTKAIHVVDKEALENFEEEELNKTIDEIWSFTPNSDGTSSLKRKVDGPYELGLERIVDIRGADVVKVLENNRYMYDTYAAKCGIVDACIQQLHEMKDQIERGYCKFGDYPAQAGAFRSGCAYHDFIGVLETLDRFWD